MVLQVRRVVAFGEKGWRGGGGWGGAQGLVFDLRGGHTGSFTLWTFIKPHKCELFTSLYINGKGKPTGNDQNAFWKSLLFFSLSTESKRVYSLIHQVFAFWVPCTRKAFCWGSGGKNEADTAPAYKEFPVQWRINMYGMSLYSKEKCPEVPRGIRWPLFVKSHLNSIPYIQEPRVIFKCDFGFSKRLIVFLPYSYN